MIDEKQRMLSIRAEALARLGAKTGQKEKDRLQALSRMLESLSFERVLDRGFAVVEDEDGKLVTSAGKTKKDQRVQLRFRGDERVGAVISTGVSRTKSV
jgi:exodeoxyribonuclease VII large subunit